MFVVDTNILISAADRNTPEHARCHELIQEWRPEAPKSYIIWKTP